MQEAELRANGECFDMTEVRALGNGNETWKVETVSASALRSRKVQTPLVRFVVDLL